MASREEIDDEAMMRLSVETYERALGMARSVEYRVQRVALPGEIGEGERKVVQVADLSIGVFRHKGQWVALQKLSVETDSYRASNMLKHVYIKLL